MFKSLRSFLFLSCKSQQRKPMLYSTGFHQFSTQSNQGLQLLISQSLKNCNTINELFYYYDRSRRGLNLIHLCILLNKFNSFQKTASKSPFLENFHNEIINLIIEKYERNEEELNTQTLTTLYFFLSHSDYENVFTKRCNFLLEEKGMFNYKEMSDQEFVGFVSGLARNNKRPYILKLLPHIIESIDTYSLGKLTMLVNCLANLNIKSTELALKTKNYLMKEQDIEKLRPVEYSQILNFFSQYPEIEDAEFFRRMEKRAQMVADICDLNSFILIVEAVNKFSKRPVGRLFYKNLEKKYNELVTELSDQMMYSLFMDFCEMGCATFVLCTKVSSEALIRADRLSQSMLVNILSNLSKSKRLTLSLLKRYTEILSQKGVNEVSSVEFEKLISAYNQFFKDIQARPSSDIAQVLGGFILEKVLALGEKQLDTVFTFLARFEKRDQWIICRELQEKAIEKNSVYFFTELMNLIVNECPEAIHEDFVEHVIDLLENNDEGVLANIDADSLQNFLEASAKVLHVLTEKEVGEASTEKRTRLFRSLEKLFVSLYKNQEDIPQELLVESKLLIYIMAFYSSAERPRPELEGIFHEALKKSSVQDFTHDHIKFLSEKTHLLEELLGGKEDDHNNNHLNISF